MERLYRRRYSLLQFILQRSRSQDRQGVFDELAGLVDLLVAISDGVGGLFVRDTPVEVLGFVEVSVSDAESSKSSVGHRLWKLKRTKLSRERNR